MSDLANLLRVPAGAVDLSAYAPRSTPGIEDGKSEGRAATEALADELSDLQERLYAAGRVGDPRRVLMVLQGMDTSGKGGVARHVMGLLDPQGVTVQSFGAPTAEERRHDFLWRVRPRVPAPGRIGVFDRSHYEDVLVPRVKGTIDVPELERRFAAIDDFERGLVDDGVTVIKVFLHLSPDEQRERLLARLDDPTKHWKYSPADVDDRLLWDDYTHAYEQAMERCRQAAPWYLVPADRKWYRTYAVATLLLEHLRGLGLGWPEATFDVDAERARVEAT